MSALFVLVAVAAAPEWKQVKSSDGIVVEARAVEGSRFAELRATATVAFPPDALCAGAFGTGKADPKEPSLKSRTVLSESEHERVAYDFIAAPVVSDRDYAVRTARVLEEGGRCRVTVDIANEFAPPPKAGVVRVEKLRCTWDFEPQSDGKTKLTYVVWTDPNTPLPAFLVEPSRQAMMITWVKLILERAGHWRAGPDGGTTP
ncbi:MAG: START domain-containing protein [Myxococcota bacterium]